MGSIKAGDLDRRIEIWRPGAPYHDGYQNVPGEPELIGQRWARFIPGQGRERFASGENMATAPAVFIIRWIAEVAEKGPLLWIIFDGRRYAIERVEEIGRREGLRIAGTARADS